MSSPSKILELDLSPERFALVKLLPDEDIPWWVESSAFFSVTRTTSELSIVCDEKAIPRSDQTHAGLRCLAVRGPLDLSEVGVIASLSRPLAEAGISIFSISSFDTDYIFVPQGAVGRAVEALEAAGHVVHRDSSP